MQLELECSGGPLDGEWWVVGTHMVVPGRGMPIEMLDTESAGVRVHRRGWYRMTLRHGNILLVWSGTDA